MSDQVSDRNYNPFVRLTQEAGDFDERAASMLKGYSDELIVMKNERDNLDDLISDRENLIKMLQAVREITSPFITKLSGSGSTVAPTKSPTMIRR